MGFAAEKGNEGGATMTGNERARGALSNATRVLIGRHPIPLTILLHLLPGALITIAFVVLGPLLERSRLHSLLAIVVPIWLILVPFELGVILCLGLRRNGRLSQDGIVLSRGHLSARAFLILAAGPTFWSITAFQSLDGVDKAILRSFFGWLPGWFQMGPLDPAAHDRPVMTATFVLYIVGNGLVGPVVDELYFRGYLLPRIEHMRGLAPLANALLFSLYHWFSPWQNLTRILAFLPVTYAASWKRNLHPDMLAHCLLNTGSCMLSARLFLGHLFAPGYFRSESGSAGEPAENPGCCSGFFRHHQFREALESRPHARRGRIRGGPARPDQGPRASVRVGMWRSEEGMMEGEDLHWPEDAILQGEGRARFPARPMPVGKPADETQDKSNGGRRRRASVDAWAQSAQTALPARSVLASAGVCVDAFDRLHKRLFLACCIRAQYIRGGGR